MPISILLALAQVRPDDYDSAIGAAHRRFGWTAGPSTFSYLVKLKGFGRGGKELRLYKVK